MSNEIYCCGALHHQIKNEFCPIQYNKKWREYSVRDLNSTSLSLMIFCPNCGSKLPPSLRDEWFDILEEKYGLEDPIENDEKKIPQEFLNDEWWKNRFTKNDNYKNIEPIDKPIRYLF